MISDRIWCLIGAVGVAAAPAVRGAVFAAVVVFHNGLNLDGRLALEAEVGLRGGGVGRTFVLENNENSLR